MRYSGGKYRIRKDLWKILNKEAEGRVFVDLFCGACNVVEGITTATHNFNPRSSCEERLTPEEITQRKVRTLC